ncbi:hypothetical protein GCM10018793_56610 [Streptomyces sulfonofaciens]|uniref:Response regulatory domain-containing protein n=1 Tax=Streptomyces sulfonofaciens TaxID=68272 RepID=A0A919GKF1_9ACTN|nr:glycosyltransferase [Streptomyces sulfonofaciens]GHH86076.1 hypothetical protein GCM10018793_56610 [Streptomyces sulfonofaciens]
MLVSQHTASTPSSAPPPGGRPGPAGPAPARVLAVGTPGPRLDRLLRALKSTGHPVAHALPPDAGSRLRHAPPDAIVVLQEDPPAHGWDGTDLIRRIRAVPTGSALPLLVVTELDTGSATVAELLGQGADDCLRDDSEPIELSARIEARLRRVPVPVESLLLDPRTGLYSYHHFLGELGRELQRARAGRRGGALTVVAVAEMAGLESRLGPRVHREVAERLAGVAEKLGNVCDRLGWDEDGHLLMLMPDVDEETTRRRLEQFAHAVAGTRFVVADENVRLTPAIGWLPIDRAAEREKLVRKASEAANEALNHRDLRPVRHAPWMDGVTHRRPRRSIVRPVLSNMTPALVLLLGLGVPFLLYQQLYLAGFDLGSAMYWVVVAGLMTSAALVALECLFSLDAPERPGSPGQPYPPASAVIAAYLPNEAATIVDTVESFLRLEYPGELEIVLAYNTPRPLPVEETLRDIARRDPRLVLLKVRGSTSKAQNINAAVSRLHGEFVGIFDADHHPEPAAFQHAWHWLSNGYDVVQGHCVIRNGDSSLVASLVAVEFESIYAVSHPGRTRMYDFGVFGGSNGFWRADLLARIRMHGSMLTEDIDSSLRALEDGVRIAMDRTLISRELAPTTLRALWNQRARWAQGWLQVSLKHQWRVLRSGPFTRRQRFGLTVLLGWREIQPWLGLQIVPILAYSAWREGGVDRLDWLVPSCLLAVLFTMASGPLQAAFAWRLAVPEIRRRKGWFWRYIVFSTFFYSHLKNMVARQAHLKEALGDRQWRVTPRTAAGAVRS